MLGLRDIRVWLLDRLVFLEDLLQIILPILHAFLERGNYIRILQGYARSMR